MGSPVVFFEVLGRDGAALRRFYTDLFEWRIDTMPEPMDYGMVAREEGGIDGGVGTAPGGGRGHAIFYVHTDDPRGTLDRASELGGSVVMPPLELPGGGVIALLADPEGHTVGVYEPAR